MGYTLGQFRRYLELATRRERRELRGQMIAALAGATGGPNVARMLKALKD